MPHCTGLTDSAKGTIEKNSHRQTFFRVPGMMLDGQKMVGYRFAQSIEPPGSLRSKGNPGHREVKGGRGGGDRSCICYRSHRDGKPISSFHFVTLWFGVADGSPAKNVLGGPPQRASLASLVRRWRTSAGILFCDNGESGATHGLQDSACLPLACSPDPPLRLGISSVKTCP
jgi:hypothetical protein